MVDMRSDMVEVRAAKEHIEKELHNVLLQLHSNQLQQLAEKGVEEDSTTIKKKVVCRWHSQNFQNHGRIFKVFWSKMKDVFHPQIMSYNIALANLETVCGGCNPLPPLYHCIHIAYL